MKKQADNVGFCRHLRKLVWVTFALCLIAVYDVVPRVRRINRTNKLINLINIVKFAQNLLTTQRGTCLFTS